MVAFKGFVNGALALTLLVASPVLAERRNLPYCAYNCFEVVSDSYFSCVYDSTYAAFVTCLFNDFAASGTYALCLDDFCSSDRAARSGWAFADQYAGKGNYEYTYETALSSALKNHTSAVDYNATELQTIPYVVSQELYDADYPTLSEFYWQLKSGELYGAATMFYWLGLMGVSGLIRFINYLFPSFVRRSSGLSKSIRKYITFPSVFGSKHCVPASVFGFPLGLLPTRLESLMIFGFYAIVLILMTVNYKLFNDNIYWPDDKSAQIARYISDRSGIMATVQVPVLILFAGRNNFLQWVTGWSFQTFMLCHRWIARSMFILAVVHSAGYTQISLAYGTFASDSASPYWICGICATIVAGLMLGQASYYFRHHWYEIFLSLHILLAIGFVVVLYYHVALEELGYYEYIWGTAGVWAGDRFFRIVRILYYGLATKAEVRIVSENVFEMRVKPSGAFFSKSASPGQYSYIHVARFQFWQSHPFSLVDYDETDGTYVYYCKAFNGVTRQIFDYANSQPSKTATLSVAIDGFYGEKYPIDKHDTIVLVAGGIGITALAQYCKYLKQRIGERQHVILHWITRYETDVIALSKLLSSVSDIVDINAYVTVTSAPSKEKTLEEKDSASSAASSQINFKFGPRPDVAELLAHDINGTEGSVVVAVCGPDTLNDACRNAVASLATAGRSGLAVQFFEESFAWA
ncbi:ferric reductase like transmembrane component-domain-containing protein [Dipodascopsis tothii]|uniref:ferric reductase like transmembrane component-domain-containing protein n=1 Tax=Dipodascopsis tothii TaxID=44089 RepID=UPI0034CF879A